MVQLEAPFSRPIPYYLGKETDTHLDKTSFHVVVESHKVSTEPLFSRLNNAGSLSRSSQDLFSRPFT